MSDMPRFSVIIPTYNRAALLADTLASVFSQRSTDFEVLIVDDGSTDETERVLSNHAGRIRVWTQANRGPGAARNVAAEHARGRYLAFLDSDDVWFPWTLELYEQVARDAGEPAFIAGKPAWFSTRDQLDTVLEGPVSVARFADYLASSDKWRWYGASSFVIRADAFRAVNGFIPDWINGEDADLAMRLGTSGGFVQVLNPCTFGYRQHDASAVSDSGRTLAGAWHIVRTEQAGRYPGSDARARQRWEILTRQVRPVMLESLRRGKPDAWRMYKATLPWHMRLGRWRFLAAFPLMAAFRSVRP